MSKDVFEHILGCHCAPTFAGIKAASLVSLPLASLRQCLQWLRQYSPVLQLHDIRVMLLAKGVRSMLVLIYRERELVRSLSQPAARSILSRYGYPCQAGLPALLQHLRHRCRRADGFPHEIGIFLDYPPADVQGFITHHGQDFCYAGYWKIYVNEEATRALFAKFTACTESFCQRLRRGVPFAELLPALPAADITGGFVHA